MQRFYSVLTGESLEPPLRWRFHGEDLTALDIALRADDLLGPCHEVLEISELFNARGEDPSVVRGYWQEFNSSDFFRVIE